MAGSRMTAARVTAGAVFLSNSSHFPPMLYSNVVKPVAFPPGRARLPTIPAPTGSGTITNTIGNVRVKCNSGGAVALPVATMTSGAQGNQFNRISPYALGITCRPSDFDPHVSSHSPTQFLQTLHECCETGLCNRTLRACGHHNADVQHSFRLLRTRGERPSDCYCAPEERDEFAAVHSMTSSARAMIVGGTVRPSTLAARKLTTRSNLIGACTGRSATFSPFRMRST